MPGRVALVEEGRTTTYAELDRRSLRLAHGLRARGVRRGDRVAFLGPNSADLVVSMFATARLGAVFLPLNTRLAAPELAYVLGHAAPRLLLWKTGFEDAVTADDVARIGTESLRLEVDAGESLAALSGPADPLPEEVGLDDLFMIQYTSGTSGRPKGVRLSHANIVWNVMNLLADVDIRRDEVALVTAPLFHTAALNQVLFPTLFKGGTALLEARFDPIRALDLIERERVSLLFGVTSMYLALASAPSFAGTDLTSLRCALTGGAPVPESVLRAWADRGVPLVQGYGLTESSPGATLLPSADGVRKLGSAGPACFFADVRVVGPDQQSMPVGEVGEVQVRGPNVTSGYWDDAAATRSAFTDDGWLHTGDLATLDDEGYLHVVDRLKDMYISGGENVYPAEVEQAIHAHPAVAECAVFGVPDERWGEVGRAVVVLQPDHPLDEAGVMAHLAGRLARYKIPRSVVFADALPHNASGKLLKQALRQEFA
jgi:fatty-acyl-CoA synthase